jgi:ketosteroid isomerase-like protein
MSQENVELVRRGIADVHAFWEMLDEHVVLDSRGFPAMAVDVGGVTCGRDEVVSANRRYWGTWEDYRLEAEELIEVGSGVVCVVRERGRGKGSGAPVERRWAQIWIFHRGRIIRWELFGDKDAALEAVGLAK